MAVVVPHCWTSGIPVDPELVELPPMGDATRGMELDADNSQPVKIIPVANAIVMIMTNFLDMHSS
jgi:hypothetical protein